MKCRASLRGTLPGKINKLYELYVKKMNISSQENEYHRREGDSVAEEFYTMQLATPNTPARAVRTAIAIFNMSFHVSRFMRIIDN